MTAIRLSFVAILLVLFGTAVVSGEDDLPVWVKHDVPLLDKGKNVAALHRGDQLLAVDEEQGNLCVEQWYFGKKVCSGQLDPKDVVTGGSAIEFFTTVIKENPKDARAYFARACTVEFQDIGSEPNKHIPILRDLSEAIRLDPSFVLARFQRAGQLRDLEKFEEAIADLNHVAKLKPDERFVFVCRGICQAKLGKFEEAIRDYNEAIRLDPERGGFYEERADALVQQKSFDKALDDLREARRRGSTPKDAQFLTEVQAWMGKADYKKTVDVASAWLRHSPGHSTAHAYLGSALAAQGAYREAVQNYKRSLERNDDHPVALNGLAWILATCEDSQLRDGKTAIRYAKQAYKGQVWRDWKKWRFAATLAAAYAESSEFGEAVKWQRKAIELAPQSERGMLTTRLKLYESRRPFRQKAEVKQR